MSNILTTRDLQVYYFLEKTKLFATARQIARLFYGEHCKDDKNALMVAQRRLKAMVDKKYLKRVRSSVAAEYIYYIGNKPPKKLDHKLMITEFISNFSKLDGMTINEISTEYSDFEERYSIRPDIRIDFEYNNRKHVALIEVDITKTFSNIDKYRALIKARATDPFVDYQLPTGRTHLISVCDKQPAQNELNILWVKTNMEYINSILYRLR